MSTYAIIKTGGKQVKVEVGQAIYVEKLDVEAGSEVTFNEVVLLVVKQLLLVHQLLKELLLLVLLENKENKESCYFQIQPKKGSHRKQGHRQPYTKVVINAINA